MASQPSRKNQRCGQGVGHPSVCFSEVKPKKYRVTYCARTSPLPLLPSGPGGIGGITSRRTRHWLILAFAAGRYLVSGRASEEQGRPAPEFRLKRRADRRGFPSCALGQSPPGPRVPPGSIEHFDPLLIPGTLPASGLASACGAHQALRRTPNRGWRSNSKESGRISARISARMAADRLTP